MIFHENPLIAKKSFTEFLDKESSITFLANFSMICLVLVSNIYNTTPNKQIIISFLMRNDKHYIDDENYNQIKIDGENEEEKEKSFFNENVNEGEEDSKSLLQESKKNFIEDNHLNKIENKSKLRFIKRL